MSPLPIAIHDTVVRLVGTEIQRSVSVAGGDINQACAVNLADGRKLFVKFNARAPTDLFETEAEGLAWLAEPAALATPGVVAYSTAPPFLILDYVEQGRPSRVWAEALGRGLAQLHSTAASSFGCLPNNYIGTLPQDNTAEATFAEFWWSRRLEPQLRLACDRKTLPRDWTQMSSGLANRLPALLPHPPHPERVHGDLWSGNVLCDADGGPVLIDPAAYGGHGEIDLAMMRLFGGFDPRVEAAYLETRPSEPGLAERMRVLQLYPLLVHANLFGGAYVHQVVSLLRAFS